LKPNLGNISHDCTELIAFWENIANLKMLFMNYFSEKKYEKHNTEKNAKKQKRG